MMSKNESAGIYVLLILSFILNGLIFYRNQKETTELKRLVVDLHLEVINSQIQKIPPQNPQFYYHDASLVAYK